MRLFNRRKEVNFEDPQLVGMSPLKTIDELHRHSRTTKMEGLSGFDENDALLMIPSAPRRMSTADLDYISGFGTNRHVTTSPARKITGGPPMLQVRRSSSFIFPRTTHPHKSSTLQYFPQRSESPPKSKPSWTRRMSVTWDSIRRSESTEAIASVGTLNRRKTLHIQPDHSISSGNNGSTKLSEKIWNAREKFSTLRSSRVSKDFEGGGGGGGGGVKNSRKIGRVQSLRILLSKSHNLIGGGKSSTCKITSGNDLSSGLSISQKVKVDQSTDTEDLPAGPYPGYLRQQHDDLEDELLLRSLSNTKISSGRRLSFQLNPTSNSMSHLPNFLEGDMDAGTWDVIDRRRCSIAGPATSSDFGQVASEISRMMKTTSCENLSSFAPPRLSRYAISTSTSDSSSNASPAVSSTNASKRSTFPYAYIRSKLTALPEEPLGTSTSTSGTQTKEAASEVVPRSKPLPVLLRRSSLFHHHSMGDLQVMSPRSLTSSFPMPEEEDEDDDEAGLMTMPTYLLNRTVSTSINSRGRPCSIACPPGHRMYDPLQQMRLQLIHKSPSSSEFEAVTDSTSQSPETWRKDKVAPPALRSFSIGDITSKNLEEMSSSGYDSDSTRTGNESPKTKDCVQRKTTQEEVARRTSILFDVDECTAPLLSSSSFSSNSSSPTESPPPPPLSGCGPLAYVTLSRKQDNGRGLIRCANNSPKVDTFNGHIKMRTLPRSHSITCLPTTLSTTPVDTKRKRRKGSVEVAPVLLHNYAKTSDADEEDNEEEDDVDEVVDKATCTAYGTTTSVIVGGLQDQVGVSSDKVDMIRRNSKSPLSRVMRTERNRSQSLCLSIFSVRFEKGPTRKSLGFSVVGGKDSPKGSMGIFIKRIFPYGQACDEGNITEGT